MLILKALTLSLAFMVVATATLAAAQGTAKTSAGRVENPAAGRPHLPPRVLAARRFLAERGLARGFPSSVKQPAQAGGSPLRWGMSRARPASQSPETAAWQAVGPSAVLTQEYGLVTGRVSALALDPSDPTGNLLYIGTTGGGVWSAQNAAAQDTSKISFTPLTDNLADLVGARDASISIGAISVQPGETGVILAGTGDPNDALDSYYGGGILRSPDSGKTWDLIPGTADQVFSFAGEGFAGFAWSTRNPDLVVAAVSQAYEGALVDAPIAHTSYQGLYYSTEAGKPKTWQLARITDGGASDVQGPSFTFAAPDGNAVTSVVWNPVRRLFIAAVRFHGYYQSGDGITWTRLANQPGSPTTIPNLGSKYCPTNPGSAGSYDCPIFRGTLAVNPLTGDTFAWTVDINNQDQGMWQDQCAVSSNACASDTIVFGTQLNTSALESDTALGRITIENGDYNLALAAVPVPSSQDTLLLAGANDLWKCSLAMGCAWRNTTNANTCMSAQVAGYQHALEWSASYPQEIFAGNDSGIWRSMDAIGETGPVCTSNDATHFQNLNGGLGSLAEVVSMSQSAGTPYTVMTGLGANGTAGVMGSSVQAGAWPQILGGEGGPVAISPGTTSTWYVNNQAGVSIHACSQQGACTPDAFGASPVVTDADVGGDGLTMTTPAPFLVDPFDSSQLLIGTCRVWRGPADGTSWSAGNAVSPVLDGNTTSTSCDGDALIRSLAAAQVSGGSEVIYVGMNGASNGGATLAGHVLGATINPSGNTPPVWQDLTLNPVSNDNLGMNSRGSGISSIFIDPHDTTGNTVYVTVEGVVHVLQQPQIVYRSIDGGAHWALMSANLPIAQANSLVVDPQDANTVYVATDVGVWFTRQIANCANVGSTCWAPYGTGMPQAPAIQLSATPASGSLHLLTAATYGRGLWQIPLSTASQVVTAATMTPASLTFASQMMGSASNAQAITVKNTGNAVLLPTVITKSGDFSETDNCQNASLSAGATCTIQVTFAPTQAGARTGRLTLMANVPGGQLTADLSGTGTLAGSITLSPAAIDFGTVAVGIKSSPQPVTATNHSGITIAVTNIDIAPPFEIAGNGCGASLKAGADCQIELKFAPTQVGAATGVLTLTTPGGAQAVQLSGNGAGAPTDTLTSTSLTFPGTWTGLHSPAQIVAITNNGDLPLTSIAETVTGAFDVTNGCGTILTGHTSCGFTVTFSPSLVGSQTGTLTISDALRTQTVSLSGTGLPPPLFAVSPAALNFAVQKVGQSSPPSTVKVSNAGGAPLANVDFRITGAAAGSFSWGAATCGAKLVNGSSCTVLVTFKPLATGGNAATLAVSSSSLGVKAVTVALNGAGTGTINVSPAQLTFPVVAPGQSSPAQTVIVNNTGSVAVSPLSVSASPPFGLVQNTCAASLAAGASCSTGVNFTPPLNGDYTGAITVSSPALAVPAKVVLNGTGGTPGAAQMQPAVVNFPATSVGATSSPVTITVTNPSPAGSLTNLTLAASPGFALVNNTCPSTLRAMASCTTGVMFMPNTPGAQTGNLTVSSAQLATGTFVPLSGMGFDFAISSSGPASQTVASGQTANYKLTVVPLNGSQGAFTFKCGLLPPNVQCSFNPASMGVTARATGIVQVQVATGLSQTTVGFKYGGGWRLLPLACGLVLLPLGWRRRRSFLLLIALLTVLAGGVSSCTASGGGLTGLIPRTGPGITPVGTFSIPVSALSGGIEHKVTLTLTVD